MPAKPAMPVQPAKHAMFLSIVIAVYNEEENIEELTARIYASMGKLKPAVPFELIYVIDGKDRSAQIAHALQKKPGHKNLIVDHSSEKRGFRNAFVKGFGLMSDKATHILTLDADLNHQPEEIPLFLEKMKQTHADIVVGSRYLGKNHVHGLNLFKRAVSVFANIVIRVWWGLKLKDKTSGYRLYRREAIEGTVPHCKSSNFEFLFEIFIIAMKRGYSIVEVPIHFIARTRGVSKFQLFRVIKGYLKLMVRRYDLKEGNHPTPRGHGSR